MSEYWVSQAKYYCKFCNVWIADNKPSRQLHDGGVKHKINVDLFHKKKRDEKLYGARSEREVQQQLAEIERAAQEALATDKREHGHLFFQKVAAGPPGPPPPPPPPRPPIGMRRGAAAGAGAVEEKEASGEAEMIEESSGIYTVDGQTYLEGQRFEEKLKSGVTCEIFIEDLDDWVPAEIRAVQEIAVPHTTLTLKTFTVAYQPKTSSASASRDEADDTTAAAVGATIGAGEAVGAAVAADRKEEESAATAAAPSSSVTGDDEKLKEVVVPVVPIVETGVRSDRLRLLVDDGGRLQKQGSGGVAEAAEPIIPVPPPIVETTGLGMWQTVSVKTVNEEEEERERRATERREREQLEQEKHEAAKKERERLRLIEAEEAADSVLGSFDPYGTNSYRGLQLSEERRTVLASETLTKGVTVGFKKRKRPGASNGTATGTGSSSNGVNASNDGIAESKVNDGGDDGDDYVGEHGRGRQGGPKAEKAGSQNGSVQMTSTQVLLAQIKAAAAQTSSSSSSSSSSVPNIGTGNPSTSASASLPSEISTAAAGTSAFSAPTNTATSVNTAAAPKQEPVKMGKISFSLGGGMGAKKFRKPSADDDDK